VPEIAFNKIDFNTGFVDTLTLTIDYKDGDSDLGLGWEIEDAQYPYHHYHFFLEDGSGDTTKVISSVFNNGLPGYFISIEIPEGSNEQLVNSDTRLKANYNYLPEHFFCSGYSDYMNFFVPLERSTAIDESYQIQDTVEDLSNNNSYIQISKPLLFEQNENFFNIFVQFFVLENEVWTEFDWEEIHCFDFNARFPEIGTEPTKIESDPFNILVKSSQEGTLTYSMRSYSFSDLFNKTMKLRISIKDRALHTSNLIETPPFRLQE
jgi:hypothetical protein